jgi:hypothetical protein
MFYLSKALVISVSCFVLMCTSLAYADVILSWAAITAPTGVTFEYKVYRKVFPSTTYPNVPLGKVPSTSLTFTDTFNTPGVQVCYVLTASPLTSTPGTTYIESAQSDQVCGIILTAPIKLKINVP